MKLCKGQDLTKLDFVFIDRKPIEWHFEQMRKEYFTKLQKSMIGKGFMSKLIHKLAKVPMGYWINI